MQSDNGGWVQQMPSIGDSSGSMFDNSNVNGTADSGGITATINDSVAHLLGPRRDPLVVVIPITFIYLMIFFVGTIGNISTCVVIAKNKSMHTATNYYLFSLSVSDFLLLVFGLPPEMYSIWSKWPYVFGETFCVLRGIAAETSANATVLTITAFTVERYVAICHPFLSHTLSKLSRAIRLILMVWLISIMLAIPQALQFGVLPMVDDIVQCTVKRIIIPHSFELSTFLFFIAPMTLITILYVLIGIKLRSSSMVKRENGTTMSRRMYCTSSVRQQSSQNTKRVLKMLVAVVVAFFICWAPFHGQRLFAIYGGNISSPFIMHLFTIMTYVSGILYYLSTCINPLLYNIMSNKFREAFKETLDYCGKCAAEQSQKCSYRNVSSGQQSNGHRSSNQNRCNHQSEQTANSTPDDSMHSASTQKQSLDSVDVNSIR